jgi:hypothetical protein
MSGGHPHPREVQTGLGERVPPPVVFLVPSSRGDAPTSWLDLFPNLSGARRSGHVPGEPAAAWSVEGASTWSVASFA